VLQNEFSYGYKILQGKNIFANDIRETLQYE